MSERTPEDRLRRAIARRLRRVEREAAAWAAAPEGDAELLHELHQQLRRLRAELALFARIRAGVTGGPSAAAIAHLAGFSRDAGRVRDGDVALGLVVRRRGRRRRPPARLGAIESRLRRVRSERRRRLARRIRGRAWIGLVTRIAGSVTSRVEPVPGEAAGPRIEKEVGRRIRRVRTRWRAAGRSPSADRLHRLRQAVRWVRAVGEAAADAQGRPVPRWPGTIQRFQAAVARLHDWDRLVRGEARRRGEPAERLPAELEARRRRAERAAVRSFRDAKVDRRLRAYLRAVRELR